MIIYIHNTIFRLFFTNIIHALKAETYFVESKLNFEQKCNNRWLALVYIGLTKSDFNIAPRCDQTSSVISLLIINGIEKYIMVAFISVYLTLMVFIFLEENINSNPLQSSSKRTLKALDTFGYYSILYVRKH